MIVTAARYQRDLATARAEVDELRRQNEWLRGMVKSLQDSMVRIERKRAGLSEQPIPRKPKVDVGSMPGTLAELVHGFDDNQTRDDIKRRCLSMRSKGVEWEAVEDQIRREYGL